MVCDLGRKIKLIYWKWLESRVVDCFNCKKKLEGIDKFSSENLVSMFGLSIPSSMSEDDRLCGECVGDLLES